MLRWFATGLLLLSCRREPTGSIDEPRPLSLSPQSLAGPSPLRRLTKRQYAAVISDVIGSDVPVGDGLPEDVPVGGFDEVAGAAPSELFIARAHRTAEHVAALVAADPTRRSRLMGCQRSTTRLEQAECWQSFLAGTAQRLFRRPLTPSERTALLARAERWTNELDFEAAVQLTLESILQSPAVLYRPEPGPTLEPYALASRLSFFLWDSAPDDALLEAARRGALADRSLVRAQAERMLADPKAKRGLWNFHRQWLGLDRLLLEEHASRVDDPSWTERTQTAALEESRRFIELVIHEEGTLGALLTSRRALLDAESARLYGVSTFEAGVPVQLPMAERSGVLSRAAFLASTSHRSSTSPPIRGAALMLRLLCRPPVPPPPGVDTTPPSKADGGTRTTRALFEERTRGPSCAGCHHSLNALGFGFEHYDAAGRYRTTEEGLVIDSTFALEGGDLEGRYTNALDLSERLAQSRDVHLCATSMWVRYALGRAPVDSEQPWVELVAQRFVDSRGDVKGLLLDLATAPSFTLLGEASP